MDYDFAHLDLLDDSEDAVARRRGWIEAVLRGFRDDRPDDEMVEKWVGHYRTDRVTVSGAWLPAGEFGAGPMPVATYASLDKTLNAGRELLPLRMITDVTTSASHRRRGLLRRLIEDDLADAVAQGIPIAALTASEATIYGRWGFGPATFRTGVEIDTTPGFTMRAFTDPGRVELIEPADAWPHVKAVFDAFHARQRGSVEWPAQYEDIHTGAYNFDGGGPNRKIRAAVHLDAAGTVDAFVIFKQAEKNSIRVEEMVALTTDAQLALWSFLGDMDRIQKLTFNLFHPEDPSSGRSPTSTGSRRPRSRSSSGCASSTSPAASRRAPGRLTARSCSRSTTRRATPPVASRSPRPAASRRSSPPTGRPTCRSRRRPSVRSTSQPSRRSSCAAVAGSAATTRPYAGSPPCPT
ncbi:MAG TPA: GNAT family N-acetyltransferase [Nocardioides sp.]|nr:GNAT family N-acetyltransferase [Nocardioides sp.]